MTEPMPEATSRFAPTVDEMRASVLWANERSERLARRVGAACRALRRGEPSERVLALLESDNAREGTDA